MGFVAKPTTILEKKAKEHYTKRLRNQPAKNHSKRQGEAADLQHMKFSTQLD